MIRFERFGKTIKLTNEDWQGIKKRYDLTKAEYDDETGEYYIKIPCSLCKKYQDEAYDCSDDCPIMKALGDDSGYYACADLLDSFFKDAKFGSGEEDISWYKSNDKQARRQIKRLNKIMDDIENNQKEATCQKTKKK